MAESVRANTMSGQPIQYQSKFNKSLSDMVLGRRETFATVLLSGLIKRYGMDLLSWDSLTIQMQIKDDFGDEPPRVVFDQLMALLTVYNTDAIYKDIVIFDKVVSALNRGAVVDVDTAPSVEDVAWAVQEIRLNDPEPATRDSQNPWSRNITKYIRAVLMDEGFTLPPRILDFVSIPAPKGPSEKPDMYAAGWQAAQSKADEIDAWVEEITVKMLQDLMEIGISLNSPGLVTSGQ